jgi:ABC-type bacteriocin/lantibiotic exporter with double-glycine peptidase domain
LPVVTGGQYRAPILSGRLVDRVSTTPGEDRGAIVQAAAVLLAFVAGLVLLRDLLEVLRRYLVEATSDLDTISERNVKQAIGTASRDLTVVMVAHRLNTFGDDGRIVETGTYAELIAPDGLFAVLAR